MISYGQLFDRSFGRSKLFLFIQVEKGTENDVIELENLADDVLLKLSQDLKPCRKTKLSRSQRNAKRHRVIYYHQDFNG